MPKLIVDGRPVEVPAGTRVIEACKEAGVIVPHFCYHPGLSVAGNCRMCAVEVELNGRSRTVMSCVEPVAEGMEVRTQAADAKDTRLGVMEFLLLNHPIDCPYCDCAGECKLQDYYMDWGNVLEGSRRDTEQVHKPKRQEIGPHVMLDSERCVLCGRCVRFLEEVTGTGELGIGERGAHSVIHLADGRTLDNAYSGNVVDLCPVGALTDRDFRFRRRVWFLNKVDSICPGCSRGCNIELHFDLKHEYKSANDAERVMRIKPRHNPQVNQWWICDTGRYGYAAIDENRLTAAALGGEEGLRQVSVEQALSCAADLLKDARRHPEQSAVLFSPQMTNEGLLAARALFLDGLGIQLSGYECEHETSAEADQLLRTADPNPNRKGCQWLELHRGNTVRGELLREISAGRVHTLICFRWDLPALLGADFAALASKLRTLIVFDTHEHKWGAAPDVLFPLAVFAEQDGTFTNCDGRVQRINAAFPPLGDARVEVQLMLELAQRLGVKLGFNTLEGAQQRLRDMRPDAWETVAAPSAPAKRVSKEAAPR